MYNNDASAAAVTGAMLSSSGHFGVQRQQVTFYIKKNSFYVHTFRQMLHLYLYGCYVKKL